MWPRVASVATVIFSSWRLKPNGQCWTRVRDPGNITQIYTLPPSNYSFYRGRSARSVSRLLEACYLMLHMIPINSCDCGHKNVSDNSSVLTLWCPLHSTLDIVLSLRACSQSSRQKRVSQNTLPSYEWKTLVFFQHLVFSQCWPPWVLLSPALFTY